MNPLRQLSTRWSTSDDRGMAEISGSAVSQARAAPAPVVSWSDPIADRVGSSRVLPWASGE